MQGPKRLCEEKTRVLPGRNRQAPPMTLSACTVLSHTIEVIDLAGPFEVFTTASRVFLRRD